MKKTILSTGWGTSLITLLLFGLMVGAPAYAAAVPEAAPLAALAIVAPVTQCADLVKTDLTAIGGAGSKVTSASETTRQGVAVCAVEGMLAPAVGFKVYLPLKSWAQRYLQVGCGGLCGSITDMVGAAEGCVPLNRGGFVIAATDMGHQGQSGSFARDLQKRADFAYRGQHITALAAKALIRAFYGRSERYAYFSGCSDGGREALVEAQRYPRDFNGIIAGAATLNFQVQNSLHHGWLAVSNTRADGKPIITAARLPLIHNAVLAQCDALDGVKDGLISDPRLCHFDPIILQCKNAGSKGDASCLSEEDVAAVRKFYQGPRDPKTGERLTIAEEMPGSELAWAGVFVPFGEDQPIFSKQIALDALRNLIFVTNPPDSYTLADLHFDKATFEALRAHHPLFDATNPDLSAFAAAGGKLIIWHGWADPHISPFNSIAYHEAVLRQMGEGKTASFERLYLLPGMHHCGGGEGPNQIDLLTPMMAWVEGHTAPQEIIARQYPNDGKQNSFGQPPRGKELPAGDKNGARKGPPPEMRKMMESMAAMAVKLDAPRSRPVYPYPAVAVYDGHGDPNKAESFHAGAPWVSEKTPVWAGSDFFAPYQSLQR
ncbi:MAG: tannase/feruloyl esterase family alpha/beta hydrolase [Rhizomicrobium sp.]